MHQPRYGRFTVRMECPKCGLPVPLDGPKLATTCTNCVSEISIQASLWTEVLERKFDSMHRRLRDGAPHADTLEVGGLRTRVEICKAPPTCEQCNSPYPVEALGTGVEQNFSCTQCGDPASTYPAPDWLKARVATACQIYHTSPKALHGESLDPNNAIRPVALTCPTCSGSLSAGTESERIMPCNYCGSEVYLPDEVWRRLHPVKLAEAFFLRFEGLSRSDLKQQAKAEKDSAEQLIKQQSKRQSKLDKQARRAEKRRQNAEDRSYFAAQGRAKQTRAWRATFVALAAFAALALHWGTIDFIGVVTAFTPANESNFLLLGGLLVVFLVSMGFASSTLKHAAKVDSDWLLFATWFWIPFAFFPPIGIWRFIVLFRGRFSATTITTGGSSTSMGSSQRYKAVRLKGGEGRPAALLFIPIIVFGSYYGMQVWKGSTEGHISSTEGHDSSTEGHDSSTEGHDSSTVQQGVLASAAGGQSSSPPSCPLASSPHYSAAPSFSPCSSA